MDIRLTARSQTMTGWLQSGHSRRDFSLSPYETCLFRLPLALRSQTLNRKSEVYCYPVTIRTQSPLEHNTIYPSAYYNEVGPFVQWMTSEKSTTGVISVVPDDPRDAGWLLWGWNAPEPPDERGLCLRWAGEATESAVVLPATPGGNYALRVEAECPIELETEAFWNGISLAKWIIGPGKKSITQPLAPAHVVQRENVLCLRHKSLWQPSVALKHPVDDRYLAVHYHRFELVGE
ncbi:hypothetical protein FJY63_08080 [Candidatus Sumerlaeota bacterium]|nr:hypothetical protein [Candidatus Sumerlaeota bacterium]